MSILDLTSVVTEFNIGPLMLERQGTFTINEYGESIRSSPTLLDIDPISVHTVSGRDLQHMPEADRNKEMIKIYTTVRLYAMDGSNDVLQYRNRRWRVTQVKDYDLQGAVYISIATLMEVQSP